MQCSTVPKAVRQELPARQGFRRQLQRGCAPERTQRHAYNLAHALPTRATQVRAPSPFAATDGRETGTA